MVKFAQLPKYEAYKDSGEGWIAEVPAHWDVRKLKHLFFEKKHTKNMSLNSGAISFGKVVTKDDDKILQSTKASYQEVLTGEFLINPLNLNYDLISLRIALSEINVVVSAGYIVIKEKEQISKKYFKYFLHMYDISYMKLLGSGVRQTISFNHISDSLLLYPPLEEQTLIANFLDQKTAQIDAAIAIKEQQIELLKERKQIIIQQAVTQGLDPNVPMKDSGVEWIGQIPEHWEVKKLKFLLTIKNGVDYKHVETDEGYPVYGSGGRFTYASSYLYDGEAVLLGRKGTIDKPLYVNEAFWTVDTMFYAVCNSRVMTKYIYFCATTIPYFYYSTATALPSMTQTDLLNHKIAVPSLKEQSEVIIYIEKESLKLDAAIDIGKQQIHKLKEYKTTLINSAVTGKIKITPEMLQA